MDNLKYYNDSLAYDFEMFSDNTARRTQEKNNVVKMPQNKKKVSAKRVSVSAFAVMASVFILAALCGNIFLRLQINEVNSMINETESKINLLESERVGLQMEFEKKISFSNVEKEAMELGMHKMEKSQVKYIRVNDENTATTKNGDTVSAQKND